MTVLNPLTSAFKKIYFLTILLFSYSFGLNAQTYVNQSLLLTDFSLTAKQTHSVTKVNGNEEILYLGSTTNQSTLQSNLILTKRDAEGTLIWQQQFAATNSLNTYGVDFEIVTGKIIVAGAVQTQQGFDYLVLQVNDTNGQVIRNDIFNSSFGLNDIPTDIATNASTIFLTGVSSNSNLDQDYYTIACNFNGVKQWEHRYNYDNADDVASNVQYTDDAIFVTGASGDSFQDYSFTTIALDPSTGFFLGDERVNNGTIGYDYPIGVTSDSQQNLFITGQANNNWLTVKVDTNLTILDSIRIKGYGIDSVQGIIIDDTNNIYLYGFSERKDKFFEAQFVKLSNQLTLIWQRNYQVESNSHTKIRFAALKESQIAFVGTTNQTLIHGGITLNGEFNWLREFEDAQLSNTKPLGITPHEANNWLISCTVEQGNSDIFGLIQLEHKKVEEIIVANPNGKPDWVDDQIIVRFNPNEVDSSFVSNPNLMHTSLQEALTPTAYSALSANLTELIDLSTLSVIKLYPNFTPADSTSINVIGETIKLKKLWSTFILTGEKFDEVAIKNSFINQFPTVFYAGRNPVAYPHWIPNDPMLNTQPSLVDNGTNNFHIDMKNAWSLEKGKPWAKVGVVDFDINSFNLDFGGTVSSNSTSKFPENVFVNSNYMTNTLNTTSNGHGTAAASIIGAISNNNEGVSGVAGGDGANGNEGVTLYGLDIKKSVNSQNTTLDIASKAIDHSIKANWNINIFNNSWGMTLTDPDFKMSEFTDYWNQVNFLFESGIPFVASRGNSNNDNHQFPATYPDPVVISVGAGNISNGQFATGHSYGKNVDVIAPAGAATVGGFGSSNPPFLTGQTPYGGLSATSAAAPHVTGLAALMVSYYNSSIPNPNNLTNEDIEALIEYYATDANAPNYDQFAGHGYINAYQTLKHIKNPTYKVRHFSFSVDPSNKVLDNANHTISLKAMYESKFTGSIIQADDYVCEVYKITATNTHSLSQTENLITSPKGTHAWARNAQSDFFGFESELYPIGGCEIISANNTTASLEGYIYKVLHPVGKPNQTLNKWLPDFGNNNGKISYSLHTLDDNAAYLEESSNQLINVFPNPSSGNLFIDLPFDNCKISIFNSLGQVVFHNDKLMIGLNTIDLYSLSNGLYYIEITNSKKPYFKKLIIQNK